VVAAVTLLWAGEIEQARAPLEAALAVAIERDEPWLGMHALSYLSAIATAAGELDLGLSYARRYEELARATDQGAQRAASMWSLSVALAWQGSETRAREAVAEGLALASGSGHALYEVGCLGALGLLELSLERGPEAVQALTEARDGAAARGVRALGRVPILPDSVEALTLAGQLPAAAEAAAEVRRRADTIRAPWALALAGRCDGLVAEAEGDSERAIVALTQALAEDARQTRRGERARTELALGRSLRRGHHKRAARETLERAAAEFEAIGAELWAQRARRELGRIGGRAASAEGELSATEQSIAELVAAGRTNQEVAASLHLSARTVEWNLSKVYRKLGVRGRTELAAAFAGQPRPEA
jgi:DNA-binding NarL/FixJ family response regulator